MDKNTLDKGERKPLEIITESPSRSNTPVKSAKKKSTATMGTPKQQRRKTTRRAGKQPSTPFIVYQRGNNSIQDKTTAVGTASDQRNFAFLPVPPATARKRAVKVKKAAQDPMRLKLEAWRKERELKLQEERLMKTKNCVTPARRVTMVGGHSAIKSARKPKAPVRLPLCSQREWMNKQIDKALRARNPRTSREIFSAIITGGRCPDALQDVEYWVQRARFEEEQGEHSEVLRLFEQAANVCTDPFQLGQALSAYMIRMGGVSPTGSPDSSLCLDSSSACLDDSFSEGEEASQAAPLTHGTTQTAGMTKEHLVFVDAELFLNGLSGPLQEGLDGAEKEEEEEEEAQQSGQIGASPEQHNCGKPEEKAVDTSFTSPVMDTQALNERGFIVVATPTRPFITNKHVASALSQVRQPSTWPLIKNVGLPLELEGNGALSTFIHQQKAVPEPEEYAKHEPLVHQPVQRLLAPGDTATAPARNNGSGKTQQERSKEKQEEEKIRNTFELMCKEDTKANAREYTKRVPLSPCVSPIASIMQPSFALDDCAVILPEEEEEEEEEECDTTAIGAGTATSLTHCRQAKAPEETFAKETQKQPSTLQGWCRGSSLPTCAFSPSKAGEGPSTPSSAASRQQEHQGSRASQRWCSPFVASFPDTCVAPSPLSSTSGRTRKPYVGAQSPIVAAASSPGANQRQRMFNSHRRQHRRRAHSSLGGPLLASKRIQSHTASSPSSAAYRSKRLQFASPQAAPLSTRRHALKLHPVAPLPPYLRPATPKHSSLRSGATRVYVPPQQQQQQQQSGAKKAGKENNSDHRASVGLPPYLRSRVANKASSLCGGAVRLQLPSPPESQRAFGGASEGRGGPGAGALPLPLLYRKEHQEEEVEPIGNDSIDQDDVSFLSSPVCHKDQKEDRQCNEEKKKEEKVACASLDWSANLLDDSDLLNNSEDDQREEEEEQKSAGTERKQPHKEKRRIARRRRSRSVSIASSASSRKASSTAAPANTSDANNSDEGGLLAAIGDREERNKGDKEAQREEAKLHRRRGARHRRRHSDATPGMMMVRLHGGFAGGTQGASEPDLGRFDTIAPVRNTSTVRRMMTAAATNGETTSNEEGGEASRITAAVVGGLITPVRRSRRLRSRTPLPPIALGSRFTDNQHLPDPDISITSLMTPAPQPRLQS